MNCLQTHLTLRVQVALSSMLLILVCSAFLVLSTNVLAGLSRTGTTVAVVPQVRTVSPEGETEFAQLGPPDSGPVDSSVTEGLLRSVEKNTLERVRLISFAAMAVTLILGGALAYWLAGRSLGPVREMSEAAQQVNAHSLDVRLKERGSRDELAVLTSTFNSMLGRLQDAFSQQSRFVADAAHELRTPFSILRTSIEVIRFDQDASVSDYAEMAETLERNLTRLEKLVANMLLLAEQGQTACQDVVFLESITEEVILDLKPLAESYAVTLALQCADESTVQGNSGSLSLALRNLIENGIRYNHPGGNVLVEIAPEGDTVLLTVRDTGVGIPEEEQTRIFERFYRLDTSRSRNTGGYGLGLSIVANIVRQHGGTVSLESSPGQGSAFKVALPLLPYRAAAANGSVGAPN